MGDLAIQAIGTVVAAALGVVASLFAFEILSSETRGQGSMVFWEYPVLVVAAVVLGVTIGGYRGRGWPRRTLPGYYRAPRSDRPPPP